MRQDRRLRRDARRVRRHYDIKTPSNGTGRRLERPTWLERVRQRMRLMTLKRYDVAGETFFVHTRNNSLPPPPRRPRRRLALVIGAVLLVAGSMGARHCWRVITTTPATLAAAEAELIKLCEVNDCSPEKLAALLRDLRQSYTTEEAGQ